MCILKPADMARKMEESTAQHSTVLLLVDGCLCTGANPTGHRRWCVSKVHHLNGAADVTAIDCAGQLLASWPGSQPPVNDFLLLPL